MSGVFGNPWFLPSTAFYGHEISQSLRFDDGDASYLTRTSSSTSTSDKQFTFSCWFKRSALSSNYFTILGTAEGGDREYFGILDTQNFIYQVNNGTNLISSQVFRDTAAWYHVVVAVNINESTASDRQKIYINGEQITSFSSANYYGSSDTVNFMKSGVATFLGRLNTTYVNSFDGYIAEAHFVDGSTLTPTSFGETSESIWIPKKYSGSHGANGFHLDFSASSFTDNGSDPDVFADQAGSNNWNAYSLAATDIMPDSPSGNNFATLNPLFNSVSQAVLSQGNLKASTAGFTSSAYGYGSTSTFAIPKDKKIYIEVECTDVAGDNWFCGFATKTSIETGVSGNTGSDGSINVYNRSVQLNGSENDYGSSAGLGGLGVAKLAAGDILGCMCDGATGKVWFSRNGTYFKTPTTNDSGTTGDPDNDNHEIGTLTGGTTDDIFFVLGGNTSADNIFVNFGQDSTNVASAQSDANGLGTFEYAPPTDYVCLCASSLSETTIGPQQDTLSDQHFEVVRWESNVVNPAAGDKQISLNFQPDWVWSKNSDNAEHHYFMDSVRGDNSGSKWLINGSSTHATKVQGADATGNSTASYDFTSTGFDIIDTNSASGEVYYNNGSASTPRKYVGWCWSAGGATPSKTYKVVVDNDGANKYRFRNSANSSTFATYAPTIELQEGGTYVFDWSDDGTNGAVSAQGHPIRFSTTSNGTHGGGTEYTTGVVKDDSAYTTTITVAAGAPTLYYYCQYHSGMGGQINTNAEFGSTNFDGSQLSVVSTNDTAQFSIIRWDGDNTNNATVGHGLSGKPNFTIIKRYTNGTANWDTNFDGLTGGTSLNFDATTAIFSPTQGYHSLGASTLTLTNGGSGIVRVNGTSSKYICYAFKNVEGHCKVGTYLGNSADDGVFVFLGFRPSFVMCRRVSGTGGWHVFDDKRTLEDDLSARFNEIDIRIEADSYDAENTSGPPHMDFLSNGFKLRTSFDNINSGTCFYIAFARQPFKFSNPR